MNIINYESDLSDDLLWTNKVLEELSESLSNESRIKAIEHKRNYKDSGYLLIDVWRSKESKKSRSGSYYPDFELTLEVLSDDQDDFNAEWVLSDDDNEEIGRFKSNTDIIYKNDEYVYSVYEDIEKLTEQIVNSIDEYIENLITEEQKEQLVDLANELIEYYNDNVDDLFTYKDAIKIVKYIMDKFDISKEDL